MTKQSSYLHQGKMCAKYEMIPTQIWYKVASTLTDVQIKVNVTTNINAMGHGLQSPIPNEVCQCNIFVGIWRSPQQVNEYEE